MSSTTWVPPVEGGDQPTQDERPSGIRWLIFVLACGTSWFLYLHRYTWNFVAPELKKEYGWTDTQAQGVYSFFNVSYGLGQIPSGILCDFFGPHAFLVAIIGMWSVALPLHAVAASRSALIMVRLLFGAAQAGTFPILAKVSRNWFPISYRTSVQACIATLAGRGGGAMASIIMGVVLIGTFGLTWRQSLWIMGGAGILFAIAFAILFRSRPETDRRVNSAELQHIHAGEIAAPATSERQFMSWPQALTSASLWVLLLMQMLVAGVDTMFQTHMKEYFVNRGADNTTAGWLVSLPLFGGAIGGTLAGFLNDALLRGNRRQVFRICCIMGVVLGGIVNVLLGGAAISSTHSSWWMRGLEITRNLVQQSAWGCLAGGVLGAASSLLLMPIAGHRRWCRSAVGCLGALGASLLFCVVAAQTSVLASAAALFSVKFFSDMQQPTQWGACTDLGGRFSATVFAIVNTAGNVGGILIPLLFGIINDMNSTMVMVEGKTRAIINFKPLMLTAGGMYAVAGLCWLIANTTHSLDRAAGEANPKG